MTVPRVLVLVVALVLPAGSVPAFELTSAAFADGADISKRHTCDGNDVSPPLAWSDPPQGTKSLVLLCEDPDAPSGTWTHWLVYGMAPDTRSLPEGVKRDPTLPGGARQGRNDFHRVGYGGPCPPPGSTHRYVFRLAALDVSPDVPAGASKLALRREIEGHVLGEARLTGRYGR
jgi:hypothetical protein